MVHGLPEEVKSRFSFVGGSDSDILTNAWARAGRFHFNVAPSNYVQELQEAGIPGVIEVLKEIIADAAQTQPE